jgi:hypothetical protein
MLHFWTICSFGFHCGAPYGQAASQRRQPMHRVESISSMPSASRFQIAPVGQVGRQAGSALWLQDMFTL